MRYLKLAASEQYIDRRVQWKTPMTLSMKKTPGGLQDNAPFRVKSVDIFSVTNTHFEDECSECKKLTKRFYNSKYKIQETFSESTSDFNANRCLSEGENDSKSEDETFDDDRWEIQNLYDERTEMKYQLRICH